MCMLYILSVELFIQKYILYVLTCVNLKLNKYIKNIYTYFNMDHQINKI